MSILNNRMDSTKDLDKALENVVKYYEKSGYKIVENESNSEFKVYTFDNDFISFSIRKYKNRLSLSRKVSIVLIATKDDTVTLENLNKEPYRYTDIRKIGDNTVFRIKGYDWSKLSYWEAQKMNEYNSEENTKCVDQ